MTGFRSRIPANFPHGLQALDDGLDLLLIFSDGDFDSTGTTFMLSDWLVHTPIEIVSQNLGLNISDLQNIPTQDPYIFRSTVPPPQEGLADEQAKESPDGNVPNPFVFSLSQQEKEVLPGGWVKVQDSKTNFKESWAATAYVYVEPNGLRELHWHREDGMSMLSLLDKVCRTNVLDSRVALHHFWAWEGYRICWRCHFKDI